MIGSECSVGPFIAAVTAENEVTLHIPEPIVTVFDGITETCQYRVLWDDYEVRWDAFYKADKIHIFDRLFTSDIQDAGGLVPALEKKRENAKEYFKTVMFYGLPIRFNPINPASHFDFKSLPEHPAYLTVTPVPTSMAILPAIAEPSIEEMWRRAHAKDVLQRNCRFLLDVIANVPRHLVDPDVPAMLLKTPDVPKPEEPKSWQPDQINESLLKGRICDW